MPKITLPGHFSGLEKIRKFVGKFAEKAGMNESDVYAIQLAVDEACSNIIEHAYGGEDLGQIECTCSVEDKSIKITLRDFGEPFEPDRVPPMEEGVPLQEIKPRGAGIFLMKHLMDEVSFEFGKESGNELTMVKHFKKEEQ
jgi:serine/threonine-protein kinase RsbW